VIMKYCEIQIIFPLLWTNHTFGTAGLPNFLSYVIQKQDQN